MIACLNSLWKKKIYVQGDSKVFDKNEKGNQTYGNKQIPYELIISQFTSLG